ncbi:MAG: metallophosphoesterase [Gammaproteobacteria bacterium]|nr:MAG: metallophosphoesterase [Gammaproteobacteria bacterium]TND03276.1 MAG: metallophosphoesterase [Gammaproteobacteria bacterium]
MEPSPQDDATLRILESRVGRVHLRQRLGIETDYEAKIFGQGRNFFHIENWISIRAVIRNSLRLFGLYSRGRRNARNIQRRQNIIPVRNLPSAFDGYTLLHITDLHLDMDNDIPRALISALSGLQYDACVLTGDFRANTFGPIDAAMRAMEMIRPHLKEPIYGVLGNHDSIRMVPGFERIGIRMLLNEFVRIDRAGGAIYIAGIDDPHYYRADNMEKASDNIPPEAVSILLAHSPEVYRHAAHAEFDVMLCGHTHGGQICLPGRVPMLLNADCPRRFCAGAWQYHQLQGYTSVGSGPCVVDARLNCPPEITLHRLVRSS